MAPTEALLGPSHQWLRAERARRPGSIPTHGVGANLLRIVREQPGIHFRALGRQAGLTSSGQLRHHLDRLADLGAIAEVKDGRFSRFFGGGDEDPNQRARQARLSRPVPNLIARLLADRPMSRTELRRRLGCADSTLGYHLNRLVQVGDIQRRIGPGGHEYVLADPSVTPPDLPWRTPPEAAADSPVAVAASPLASSPAIPPLPPAFAAAPAPVPSTPGFLQAPAPLTAPAAPLPPAAPSLPAPSAPEAPEPTPAPSPQPTAPSGPGPDAVPAAGAAGAALRDPAVLV
jgi:DNA-binding transcriptional ArsR family regulator